MTRTIILLSLLLMTSISVVAQKNMTPEEVVEKQLTAYNSRDIDGFVNMYADDVKIYDFQNKLLYQGIAEIRAQYNDFFTKVPDLHIEILQRIVHKNTVIDHEKVIFSKNEKPLECTILYHIEKQKITEVYFLTPLTIWEKP